MFKKFTMVLAAFLLAPLNLVLIDSSARADTYYWTGWGRCNYNFKDYTPWRAYVQVRSSDRAARPIQIQYGNGNSETVLRVNAWDSSTKGRVILDTIQFYDTNFYKNGLAGIRTGGATDWTSPRFYPTWVGGKDQQRFANVQFDRGGGVLPVCESKLSLD